MAQINYKLSPGKENLEVYNDKGVIINRHPIAGLPTMLEAFQKQKENLLARQKQEMDQVDGRISGVQELIDQSDLLAKKK